MGTSSLFNIGVSGIPVYRLEDRQEVDLHSYWLELGGVINLGHGIGFLCIIVEGFYSAMVWSCVTRMSHLDMGVM